jgi:RimJ/RimL family protein N-acetyltransferase
MVYEFVTDRLKLRQWRPEDYPIFAEGHGYATEAANVVLKFAFETLNLAEIVSFTAVDNLRSQAVMQRINLKNTNKNFDHPRVPIGHPLREHVLYQISQRDYLSSNPS